MPPPPPLTVFLVKMDTGITSSYSQAVLNPLPPSWLGRPDAPPSPPTWANIGVLSSNQIQCLLSQIAYDKSTWDYRKVGNNNQLGRYQFSSVILESYGLIANGSNDQYGTGCVNYAHCWTPTFITDGINTYGNYFYNVTSLGSFLTNTATQEHLAYQRVVDIYLTSLNSGVIFDTDTADIVAGMIYVGWTLGVGGPQTSSNPSGTGAWAWRNFNIGDYGTVSFNSGRYAVNALANK